MRAVALLLLCPTLLYADGPCPPLSTANIGWDKDTTVYVDVQSPELAAAASQAMQDWTKANIATGVNINFEPFTGSSDPNLLKIAIRYEPFTGEQVGGDFTISVNTESHRPHWPPPGIIRINANWIKPSLAGFQEAARKAINHEIGHSMGLDDTPFAFQLKHGSVMNGIAGMNDGGDNMPDKPTTCDKDTTAGARGVKTGNGGGSGGTPSGIPSRPKPPGMPGGVGGGGICHPCTIRISIIEGRPRETTGWCCGANAINAYPRPDDLGPMMAFLNTHYRCSDDNWLELKCAADMCCAHPDDVPPVSTITYGQTCGQMGWWWSDQRSECETAAGTPPNAPESEKRCVKKEICGYGYCEGWPHYCWKIPNMPGPGGSGGGGGDEDPTPNGKSCGQMGWYDGTNEGNIECFRDHTRCERKQNCDGQCYPDPPGYCWEGHD